MYIKILGFNLKYLGSPLLTLNYKSNKIYIFDISLNLETS